MKSSLKISTEILLTMARILLFTLPLLLASMNVKADNAPEWRNPLVNQQNREARHANFFAFEDEEKARVGEKAA